MDGSPVTFTNWKGDAQQNKECVSLRYTGTWEDKDCMTAQQSVCRKPESEF